MATTKKEIASFQPVFPKQYPQECQSCKTPTVCEKFMVGGLKADTGCCIFICPRRHRKVAPSKSKIDGNMMTDSAPGASDFVTEKNKKILLLRAFLIPGTDEGGIPREIRHRRKASFYAQIPNNINPSILGVAGTFDVVADDNGLVAG